MKNLNLLFVLFTFATLLGCKTSTSNNVQTEEKEIMVLIQTNQGDIKIKLYNETPYHRDNFIKLVNESFYDSLIFHRVIKDFMIQGGDPDSKGASSSTVLGSGGPGYTIPAEINPDLFHKKGALSAARTGDQMNPTRRSSGSQFYIVQGKPLTDAELDFYEQKMSTVFSETQRNIYTTIGGTPFLDGQYTVFGEVVEGLDILDKIAAMETGTNDRPKTDIVILSMKITK
jgi:peptidyl-prolyl cis-trans isomerase B (cyclophilin B)